MLTEKVQHLHRSYQSLLSVSESLAAEISVLSDWIHNVKPMMSATQQPVTNLNMQEMQDLLASHEVCKCIAIDCSIVFSQFLSIIHYTF